MGLQKFDEFSSQHAIQPLPCFQGQTKKLHPELMTLAPFNLAKLNGQILRMLGKQHIHTEIITEEGLSIGHDGTPHQRQVGQDIPGDEWGSSERNEVTLSH